METYDSNSTHTHTHTQTDTHTHKWKERKIKVTSTSFSFGIRTRGLEYGCLHNCDNVYISVCLMRTQKGVTEVMPS